MQAKGNDLQVSADRLLITTALAELCYNQRRFYGGSQMLRSKTFPFLLLITSLAVVALLFAILFGPLREGRGSAFGFAFGCAPLCWLCSVACGLCAVKRNNAAFPKLEMVSFMLLGLLFFSFMASWIVLNSMLDDAARVIAGVVYASGALWCLVSLLVTIVVIFRDARNFSTWIIFITQILWATSSFHFYHLAIAIGDSC